MIVEFENEYLEALYEGRPVKGKPRYSESVIQKFVDKVNILRDVAKSPDLYKFRSLNFEALRGDRKGTYSIRVDKSYRLEFRLTHEKVSLLEIAHLDDLSKHYD